MKPLLRTMKYRKRLAAVLARAIAQYFSQPSAARPSGPVAGGPVAGGPGCAAMTAAAARRRGKWDKRRRHSSTI